MENEENNELEEKDTKSVDEKSMSSNIVTPEIEQPNKETVRDSDDSLDVDKVEPVSEKHIDLEDIQKKFENIELTFVKKINQLEVENTKLEKQIKFYYSSHEKLLELVDQQNYLNRLIKRVSEEKKFATRNLALKILKPIDWLEQTLKGASAADNAAENSWLKGLAHVNERFISALAEENIKLINVKVGDEFDHKTCNAVEQKETAEFPPNSIVEICDKGYYLYDRVLRHATVIVAKKPHEDAVTPESQPTDQETEKQETVTEIPKSI